VLQKDVSEILEIKCDMVVTDDFTKDEKLEYLGLLKNFSGDGTSSSPIKIPQVSTNLFETKEDDSLIERFEWIAKPIKRTAVVFQAGFIGVCMAALIGSYCFILQPVYTPPQEDIYTNSTVQEVKTTSSEWYLIKHKDGSYSLAKDDGFECPIKNESVELLISDGLLVKKE